MGSPCTQVWNIDREGDAGAVHVSDQATHICGEDIVRPTERALLRGGDATAN